MAAKDKVATDPSRLRRRKKSVPVSSQTHQQLLSTLLLREDTNLSSTLTPLDPQHHDTAVTYDDEVRLLKRITQLHDSLLELGFDENATRIILIEGNVSSSLESALDWACLHLPTKDLPSFLVDHVESIEAMLESQQQLSVVVAPASKSKEDRDERRRCVMLKDTVPEMALQLHLASLRSTKEEEEELNDSSQQEAQKAWLLAHYEYEEDENDVSNDIDHQVKVQDVVPLSPDEAELEKTKAELLELESILKDDAQMYMMSKYEIKDTQKKSKQLKKQVEGLRRKVETQRVKLIADAPNTVAPLATTEAADGGMNSMFAQVDDDDDEGAGETDGGGLFYMFDDETDAPTTEESSQDISPTAFVNDIAIPDYSIPTAWTGKTPKQLLEDWCKRKKVSRPRYTQLQQGARIVVSTLVEIHEEGPFGSYQEGQHYLATRALYTLNPNLPMYRLLPPVFRDLWLSWVDSVKQEKQSAELERLNDKEQKMQQIVDSILARRAKNSTRNEPNANKASDKKDKELIASTEALDEWEDVAEFWEDDGMSEPDSLAKVQFSEQGIKLRASFHARRVTPQYQAMLQDRQRLPMFSYRQQLLDTIRENQVTVLCAQTGAGKTTQCPQFLLEEALEAGFGDQASILCTQPRRVSAISVAERVAEEFCDSRIGETIGYHIRLESKRSARTKLLFCTTGVVLRRLQDDPTLEGVTHVIVDEVHERQWQIDFLLIVLRRLIQTTRKDLKVVLMSATLDAQLFTQFFPGAPLVSVPGRTFPVANYYLEDLLEATNHVIEEGSRCAMRKERDGRAGTLWVTKKGGEKRRENFSTDDDAHLSDVSDNYVGYKITTRRSMDRVDEQVVNYDLIEDVLLALLVNSDANESLKPPDGSVDVSAGAVLVFLPGAGEIQTLRERLEGNRTFGNRHRFDIIPMHSTLSPKDQRRAFIKSKKGCQKIILATSIAETSVTIPDVVCVIDTGLVREVHQNKNTSTSTLITTWCSRASIKQRSGRAGRVQAGICCRLFSSRTTKHRMKDQAIPELQRVPLEEVCLSILAGRLGNDCMEFLQQAPQPPSGESVTLALGLLRGVGAIDTNEQLTPLGHHLSKLPLDVRLGKMLLMGCLFRCLDPVLTVASSLSCKAIFPSYARDSLEAQTRHKAFRHSTSDFMTVYNVWKAYQDAKSAGKARGFCDENYLSRSALMEIGDQKEQFLSLLRQIGFVSKVSNETGNKQKTFDVPSRSNENSKNEPVIHAVICAGLYPNVARVDTDSKPPTLIHNKEQVHIHKSSVNSTAQTLTSTSLQWIMFYEKFATHKVYISDTALVHPFSLLLFGGPLLVKHCERKVMVGDWIEIPVAAQTGVLFRELRARLDKALFHMMERPDVETSYDLTSGIVKLIGTSK